MKKLKIRDEQKGIIFIVLIFVITAGLSFFFSLNLRTNEVKDYLKSNDLLKTLFLIEDDDGGALFSSVLIYVPATQKAAFINLPEHTGKIFQTLGRVDKLSVVYSEAGINGFLEEVEKLLGLKIPFYAIMTLNDFVKISDYLGGMRVFISEPVDFYSENGERRLLPSGAVNLDGDKVSVYLKYRLESEAEADVQERYQNIFAAFLTDLHSQRSEIFDKKSFKKYSSCFSTNVSEDEFKTLLEEISNLDSESIIKQTITGSLRQVDGNRLLFPDNNGEFLKEAVKQTANMLVSADGTSSARVYVLEIQNGTTTQGLARNTAILFQNASYDVLSPVNANRNDYEETIIVDHIGNPEVAKMVGEFINCSNIIDEIDFEEVGDFSSEASVDFTIILGRDFNGRYVVSRKSSQ